MLVFLTDRWYFEGSSFFTHLRIVFRSLPNHCSLSHVFDQVKLPILKHIFSPPGRDFLPKVGNFQVPLLRILTVPFTQDYSGSFLDCSVDLIELFCCVTIPIVRFIDKPIPCLFLVAGDFE